MNAIGDPELPADDRLLSSRQRAGGSGESSCARRITSATCTWPTRTGRVFPAEVGRVRLRAVLRQPARDRLRQADQRGREHHRSRGAGPARGRAAAQRVRALAKHRAPSTEHSGMRPPDWIEPMAATLTQERFTGAEWTFERKDDGIRLLAYRRGPEVQLFSRNRLPQHIPAIEAAIAELPVEDVVLDGEVTWDSSGAYHVFDIMWLDGRDLMALPLHERQALLQALPLRAPVQRVEALNDPRPWERAAAEGSRIFVQTIFPTKNDFLINKINETNQILRNYKKPKLYTLVETHALFADSADHMKKEYTNDGVHLTEKGYEVWVNHLRRFFKSREQ